MDQLRAAPGAEVVLSAVAGEPGVYVVGGAVRDALLGRVPRELDLVVEGDAVAVARRAAERVGGALTVHERFGTATVQADGFAFDLAGARRETLLPARRAPGRAARAPSIEEDLARRDFTRQRDRASGSPTTRSWRSPAPATISSAGVLRVLHDRSFVDDPTRMLRLVRYAHRLSFEPDPDTAALRRSRAARDRVRRPDRQRAAAAGARGRGGRARALRARRSAGPSRLAGARAGSRSPTHGSSGSGSPPVSSPWSTA